VRVLELRTDRRRNVELHRACVEAVRRALDHVAEPASPMGPGAGTG
jgi:hypothetical protein